MGAVFDDDLGPNAGAAYIYRFDGTGWRQRNKLTASDGLGGAEFGNQVALNGNLILVGAPGGSGVVPLSGTAYLFEIP